MDDDELIALAALPAASDPITARTVAGLVAEEIAAPVAAFDPAAAAALVASQEHRFRSQRPEALADELHRLRGWKQLVAAARARQSGARRRLLESFGFDLDAAVIGRAQLLTEPAGTLTGGWGFDRPGPPCVLLTSQLPPDLTPWPDAGLPFPVWRSKASAEAALAALRARPPAGYDDIGRYFVRWTCFQAGDPDGPVVLDEAFWNGR
ncbi:hypothetical protein L3Q65_00410 (plasmid) [Amycolatopsis sp. FU40]|uniref:hypothetical protein n=1 Tax=Amycolatopsis sp. FU40 TaxID=2914159 RepID=UPI001F3CF163|nr:hypothetical protein [Amycolatopsis sp. FU40]UKD50791.1 hypothetical protein L3Q65_00410 [Amycolatopsis sp. FU40]